MTKTISNVANHDNDTGSTAVQIAGLTEKIENLSEHLKNNPKDTHSRRGLLQMVANRRKLISYLQRTSRGRYNALAETLGLKSIN